MRYMKMIFALCVALMCLTGCFKEEKQGTLMKIRLSSQNVATDEIQPCKTELRAYAFNVGKGEKWEVASWEDALDMVITNSTTSQVLTAPNVIGTWDGEAEYQLSLDLRAQYTSLVVVDVENRLYAYRDYETPINWPVTCVELHLYAHKKSGTANGWTFVNPFPDEAREPLDEENVEIETSRWQE